MLAAAIALLITDVIYGSVLLGGTGYGIGGALDAGWAIFYAFLGAAALHPSMRQLSERGPAADTRLTRQRLALLGSASLTVPLVIVVRSALHQSVDLYVLIAASGIMFALVLMRLAGIVRHNEAATQREAALRVAGETLVSATTRDAVYEAALEAAHAVVDMPLRAPCTGPGGPWRARAGRPRRGQNPRPAANPPADAPRLSNARDAKLRVASFELAGSEVCSLRCSYASVWRESWPSSPSTRSTTPPRRASPRSPARSRSRCRASPSPKRAPTSAPRRGSAR